jgi:two-component system nitrate/nitrite response regulator NarL
MRRPTGDLPAAVVVDNHPMMRSGIVDALARGGFDVVADGAVLADIRRPMRRRPAVILVGWEDGGRHDLDGLSQLVDAEPASKIVVLAPSPADAFEAFAVGASAFILKTVDPDDLAPVIRQLVDENIIAAPGREEAATPSAPCLTPREKQVLSRVAAGASNGATAAELWLSEPTVKFHLRNIYRKLGANGRVDAARRARELGLIPRSHALTSPPMR